MRKIDKLIFRAVFPPFIVTLTVLTFIVFLTKIGEWSKLFITNHASLEIVSITTFAIFPAILIFSLPISYMIGILIGISGLNGESQITALRACGVPVRRLLSCILLMGIVVGAITAAMTLVVVPGANSYLLNIRDKIVFSQAPSELQARVFNVDLPDRVFYLEDISASKKEWFNIFMVTETDSDSPSITLARKGTWVSVDDSSERRFQLHLEDGAQYSIDLTKPENDQSTAFRATDVTISLDRPNNGNANETDHLRKTSEMNTFELLNRARGPESNDQLKSLVELNQRIALPLSVFPFTLLGLTLAVRSSRGGRTSGFILSLIVVIPFYILFVNGIRLARIGEINPWVGPWAANIFLGCLGIFLLIKSESNYRSYSLPSIKRLKNTWDKLCARYLLQSSHSGGVSRGENRLLLSIRSLFRFLFPKIFDLYILKGFLTYFFWSLITCSVLFMLFTLFELLDDVIRNETPLILVMEYFTFLIPQVLMMAIPMSVLLGVLINFGILEKNSEIKAMKAGGWSLYRISIPIFFVAGAFSISLFLLQDYILPTSNERQDSIWSSIKGRPPRTSMMKRKWILGEKGRIYNYEHFDETKDAFVGLNVFEIDMDSARIVRIIRAPQAKIDANGEWRLRNGWIRNYRMQQNGFQRFDASKFDFPEKADYFKREIFQPTESSKMTYNELMRHITYLMKSGYNAIELQVELWKKISFPFSCLVMAILAIPFSFVLGRKGAFFGIGASIAISILYMMIMSLFESMGTYGILTPFLAAWAPNIIFGAAGFWLFLSIRT